MNIRMMAQSQLMQGGFSVNSRRNAYDWTANLNSRINAPGQQQNNTSASNETIAAGNNIQNALDELQGRNGTLTGRTSDAEVATVRVDNSRLLAATPPRDARVEVQQLAAAQANEGEALNHNHRDTGTGNFTFAIESGGRTHTFNIAIEASDSNEDIQNRMAAAINARRETTGVMASIASQGTGDDRTTALTLESTLTGTNNRFTVTDVQGDLAETMGVTTTSRQAQNAAFTVNGARHASQSNEVELQRGVHLTLQGVGTGENGTNITFARNAEDTIAAATGLVNALNNALGSINTNAGRGNQRMVNDIQGMNRTFASSLRNVGINVDSNGRLSIDQARMQRAAEDGSLDRMFGADNNSSFTARVGRIANNAASGSYRNTSSPSPVQVTAPNNMFDFGNAGQQWNMMSLFV
ncbi:MAG: flagellar filament capping protein FliD [Defluviitaleaceae bacterium]|nr:flagellar filament capping protein FliD [Defluviitaleaceae bacterium]